MGGPSQTTSTQQTSQVQLPAWVNDAAQQNYQQASQVADRPLQQYEGQRVADPSDMTTQGYGLLKSDVGNTQPLYDQAAGLQTAAAGPLDIKSYMDPYVNDVVDRSVANANTALTQQMAGNSSVAEKAGAFGGSRFGVQQGVTQAQGVKNIGDLTAGLLSDAYGKATTTAEQQQQAKLAAAQGLLSTASGKQGAQQQDITNLMTAGQQDQTQRQSVINAAMQKFQDAWQYPTDQINLKLAALGMTPYGKTQTTSGTSDTSTSPDWATVGLGALKSLPGAASGLTSLLALSDRDSKTDIQKVSDGDIPMYAYRYKGDPKTYPKIVGPMAQDIEKKFPKAVKKVGRYKAIHLGNLMESLA